LQGYFGFDQRGFSKLNIDQFLSVTEWSLWREKYIFNRLSKGREKSSKTENAASEGVKESGCKLG
jgi:hypothetical protein